MQKSSKKVRDTSPIEMTLEQLQHLVIKLPPGFESAQYTLAALWAPGSRTPRIGLLDQEPKFKSGIDDLKKLARVSGVIRGPEAQELKAVKTQTAEKVLFNVKGENPTANFKPEVVKTKALSDRTEILLKAVNDNNSTDLLNKHMKEIISQAILRIRDAGYKHLVALASGKNSDFDRLIVDEGVPKNLYERIANSSPPDRTIPLFKFFFPTKAENGLCLTIREILSGKCRWILSILQDYAHPVINLILNEKSFRTMIGGRSDDLSATNADDILILDTKIILFNPFDILGMLKDGKKAIFNPSPPKGQGRLIHQVNTALMQFYQGIVPVSRLAPSWYKQLYKEKVDTKSATELRTQLIELLEKKSLEQLAILATDFLVLFEKEIVQLVPFSEKQKIVLLPLDGKDKEGKDIILPPPAFADRISNFKFEENISLREVRTLFDISDRDEHLFKEARIQKKMVYDLLAPNIKKQTGQAGLALQTLETHHKEFLKIEASTHGFDYAASLVRFLVSFQDKNMMEAAFRRLTAESARRDINLDEPLQSVEDPTSFLY